MMEKAKILEQLIKERGYNLKSFSKKCGIPYTTLYGIIKNGVGRASMDNILTICKSLGIRAEDLDDMSSVTACEEKEPSYNDLVSIITKNGTKLTTDEKMQLIKLLSEL
jgi:predicted transcriptional regulator